ncbi:MAG: murein L,D-transpeptidase [Xanthobacteraceae bacterium]|nr:murein L,D-transpeptidase [Xanthobacteraceae bacterium]
MPFTAAILGESALNRSPLVRTLLACAAISVAVPLSGCNTDGVLPMSEKAARPLPPKLVAEIESKSMDKESPILVRVFKEESELEVWKQDRSGRFALLKAYPICRWSGELGPKIKEGDRQAPEGFYTITPGQMNPNSAYYLSFDLGYPNAFDRAHGRTGSQLMVHGDCSSRGCYSMTDEQISEIYALGRDSFFGGQKSFQVQAYPFRMTPQNMAKHRNSPHLAFWKMLKKGYDHFEVSKLEPRVNVCEKRYVFDAQSPGDPSRALTFSAQAKCPVYEVDAEIAAAVQQKEQRDDARFAELVRRNVATAPIKTNADGGMHPVFVDAVKRNQVGVAPSSAFLASTPPGTIPPTVRPPRIPELSDAPAVAGAAPAAHPSGEVSPQMAIADTTSSAPQTTAKPTNFFSNLFASKSETKAAETKATEKKSDGAIDRMARLVGIRRDEPKAAEAAKPKPAAAKPAQPAPSAANGAIRPKPAEAPVKTAEAQAPIPAPAASNPFPPAPAAQRAPAATAPAGSSGLSGAAPVVPSGNFDSRWSAFR